MGVVLPFHSAASGALGHKSGRKSERDTAPPVAPSIRGAHSAGTPRLECKSAYEMSCCLTPMALAKSSWLPAIAMARFSALDIPSPYLDSGDMQLEKMSAQTHANFGIKRTMRRADPHSVGHRVKARREELGLSQKDLGDEAGYSQQNIATIEAGGLKRPERFVATISTALRTTMDYLLYNEGPKDYGPQFLSNKDLVENFALLTPEVKEAFSKGLVAAVKKVQRKKDRA